MSTPHKKVAFVDDGRVSLGGGICASKKMAVEAAATACVTGDKEEDGGCAHAEKRHADGFTSSLEAAAVAVTMMKSNNSGDSDYPTART
ncbi:hypothetical protein GUJ93_ZPchr0005g15406 [Zizania palustris]|uniref:Uncharacterized protein n=1 Tax=Zizania palustris TaxID=103762 RepID=A0A8J5VGC2_ZIZPA|nr:hypothetical protein GUJ93_ZPchr0005g15406 [Zizania palustris]